ncbi:hypothetical protein [Geodermatophilus ruber]|nr:hypothetical protein [Geodermatophilus ruber]
MTAQRGGPGTDPRMPNAAPPLHPAVRRRTAAASTAPAARPGLSVASSVTPSSAGDPAPALTGVPASWAGLGALLTGAGDRTPADALALASIAAGEKPAAPPVDLSGIWALPADMAAARSGHLVRALDVKGRLPLPVEVAAATRLPAERDGAVLTAFLPGSPEQPRPNYATTALPLDGRGRLTLSPGVRRLAGIPDGADVLVVLDPDRGTVTLTAASRLAAEITGLIDGLRRPATASSEAVGPTELPLADSGDDTDATPSDVAHTAEATASAGRLRIVR